MAKKPEITPEQERTLRKAGLTPGMWIVLQDLPGTMLIRNPGTGECRVLFKKDTPS